MNFELSLLTVMKFIICPSDSTVREVDALYLVWTLCWSQQAELLSCFVPQILREKSIFRFVLLCKGSHLYYERGQDYGSNNTH